jgi:phosphopantothenoylcysteine synthetase/decarboxylase
LIDVAAGKVKSNHEELWLRLVRTPKLVDNIRTDWKFTGILVKFKLEVGIGERTLLDIAEESRRQSCADLMVANTLEEASQWAYVGPLSRNYEKVSRADLPARLLAAIESCHARKSHG